MLASVLKKKTKTKSKPSPAFSPHLKLNTLPKKVVSSLLSVPEHLWHRVLGNDASSLASNLKLKDTTSTDVEKCVKGQSSYKTAPGGKKTHCIYKASQCV